MLKSKMNILCVKEEYGGKLRLFKLLVKSLNFIMMIIVMKRKDRRSIKVNVRLFNV